MQRQVIHVDMDAFYASVEVLDDPSLAGKPVIVGGSVEARGVVAAASYAVRKYGVRSAMPMKTALKLCPQAIVLPVRMSRYKELSERIHAIFQRYTPLIEPISIDEAFLDVTGCPLGAVEIGRKIKADIKNELGLTASAGIAPNKFLAKLASDLEKPDGFVVVTEENKQAILDPLPVSAIYGVGKSATEKLNAIGIRTIAQLRKFDVQHLRGIFGSWAETVLDFASGIDDRPVVGHSEPKSISVEETFAKDIKDKRTLCEVLFGQVQEVSTRLRDEKAQAKSVHLKMRYGDFTTITRAKTFAEATDKSDLLWAAAQELFNSWYEKEAGALRLLGFCASNLTKISERQLLLFGEEKSQKQGKIDKTIDAIKQKYGDDAIKRRF